ncbi:hypothetical protein B0T11DRAFT_100544 [Plectosphaerella cucumerina]|uniref:NmrA-like domain-containing protein n=1 Tax=Plectosphaerella cucumerina TaxID=40658 RepID=A0A8K0TGS5_9PEZI|nr:hypothetical protein B0T11DRAFT_100544 [Plectosphaerella cucumerina]
MMRIAIAGAGPFAERLAHHLCLTSNPVIVLSRTPRPDFEEQHECQVIAVNYDDAAGLRFALQGVDLVISTFRGPSQISLIHAARRAGVRCFVPAEFEGGLSHRPTDDMLDYGSAEALALLRQFANSTHRPMQWTVFSCGIFYERFAPGGLGAYGLGTSMSIINQGDYLVDMGEGSAHIMETNGGGRTAYVCLTAVDDVARFVAAAVELGLDTWPREFKMRGDRLSVRDIFATCSNIRGVGFSLRTRRYSQFDRDLSRAAAAQDWAEWWYLQRLRATADGRYDFRVANLNDAVSRNDLVAFTPTPFRAWLEMLWAPPQ